VNAPTDPRPGPPTAGSTSNPNGRSAKSDDRYEISRQRMMEMARRNLRHTIDGTVPLDEGVMRVPAQNYVNADRWRLEMDRIFKRLPLVLGFSCELPETNSYKAMEMAGVPILLTRGDDGAVRSFVNMCSHRGAIVVEEGRGVSRRHVCPYHAWTYDPKGELVGILDKANFGEIDMSCHGLTELPVAEREGIIFGGITPGSCVDVDTLLAGYDDYLHHLGLADCTLVGQQTIAGPNWKLAYDGYLDFYHLPILHKDTFGPAYNNKTINDAWGPHQRNTAPDSRHGALAEIPESEWKMSKISGGIWTIFPHVSIASFDAGGKLFMISVLTPGDSPETSVTTQYFLAAFTPTEEGMETINQQIAFLRHVVEDEDYYTGLRIQKAIKTGAKQDFVFGRNEGPCQRFHGWVDNLVAAETLADTEALLAASTEFHHP
jgi:carnitine monooxygenase subunit